MLQTLAASDLNLNTLQKAFGLQKVEDNFTAAFLATAQPPTALETEILNRIRANYDNLMTYGSLSEESVKMVILSYLLDLAGFYLPPFQILTEPSVKIITEDGTLQIKGDIDVLVIADQFWILVIESKATRFDVMVALPQALSYMLARPQTPTPSETIYGLLVNGREFIFIKLDRTPSPVYSLSRAFSINNPATDLLDVLNLLKAIAQTLQIPTPRS